MKGRLYRLGKEEQARIESQLRTVLEREPDIAFAYLYGSFLESGTFHDVDVGIYMTASSAVRETDQALQLAHRLSEETGLPIDIRIVNQAPVSFQYHVLKGRLLLGHDPDLLAAVMESVVRQYLDMAPLLRWATREAFARMNLNPDLIRARCAEIEESVARLEQFHVFSIEQFLADRDTQDVACYRLLIAIEAALALCYHVSAKRLKRVPEEYAQCFRLLYEDGLIPQDLMQNLQQMARFRNLLVHMYWKIDYSRVYSAIRSHLVICALLQRLWRNSCE